jgi:hypothetical protein
MRAQSQGLEAKSASAEKRDTRFSVVIWHALVSSGTRAGPQRL